MCCQKKVGTQPDAPIGVALLELGRELAQVAGDQGQEHPVRELHVAGQKPTMSLLKA